LPPGTRDQAEAMLLDATYARKILSGFFLTGVLMAFLGAILPAWGYHLQPGYLTVGNFFLAMNAGTLVGVKVVRGLLQRWGLRAVLVGGSLAACGALLYLAAVPPAAHAAWRVAGVFVVGTSVGLISPALFHALLPLYHHEPAATLTLAGTFFGLGCWVTAVLVAGTFYVYTVPSILVLMAVIPGLLAGLYAKTDFRPPPLPAIRGWREALGDFRSPATLLFGVVLFLQFGNEWAVAGWLPIFLVQRLGVSPAASVQLLALYWFSLLAGRALVQWLLPAVSHARLLLLSAVGAVFGCAILSFTNNRFGAGTGVMLVGLSYAAIYPLVAEKIRDVFPYYHPGFFSGVFALALTGALLAPWSLGVYAHYWGIRVVMLFPLAGSLAVFGLLIVLWLVARLTAAPQVRAAVG
jgi:fucose permease